MAGWAPRPTIRWTPSARFSRSANWGTSWRAYTFNETGKHTITITAKDNDGVQKQTSVVATVYAMSLDISAGSACVGVGNLLPVTLAWEPDESLDVGCLELVSAAGSPVKVWEDQAKSNLLIDS